MTPQTSQMAYKSVLLRCECGDSCHHLCPAIGDISLSTLLPPFRSLIILHESISTDTRFSHGIPWILPSLLSLLLGKYFSITQNRLAAFACSTSSETRCSTTTFCRSLLKEAANTVKPFCYLKRCFYPHSTQMDRTSDWLLCFHCNEGQAML